MNSHFYIVILAGMLLSPPGSRGRGVPRTRVLWNEANAALANAVKPADYLRAARSYQALVDSGVRNGPLFYNLGTALLKAGDVR